MKVARFDGTKMGMNFTNKSLTKFSNSIKINAQHYTKIVAYSVHYCNSNQHTKYNDEKIRFFSLPTYQKLLQKRGKQAQKQRDATTIKNNQ